MIPIKAWIKGKIQRFTLKNTKEERIKKMKRKYKMISIVISFVLISGILVFGMSQWNKQIDETAEQAKEDLNSTEQAKEEDLNVAEQAKDDSNLNGKSSTSVGDASKEEDLSTSEKKQSESVRKP